MKNKLLVFAAIYGATLLVVILALSFWKSDMPDDLFRVVRTTMALAAAGFGGALAGSFRIQGKIARVSVTATGALALGALVYLVDPLPEDSSERIASPVITDVGGNVEVTYRGWRVQYTPQRELTDQEIQKLIQEHPGDWRKVLEARLASEPPRIIDSPEIHDVKKDVKIDYTGKGGEAGSEAAARPGGES